MLTRLLLLTANRLCKSQPVSVLAAQAPPGFTAFRAKLHLPFPVAFSTMATADLAFPGLPETWNEETKDETGAGMSKT